MSNNIKRLNIFLKGKKFINKCLKGFFINKRDKFIKINTKIISAIIPVFNSEKTILHSIRSIQNQNMSNIEIILVNDFSKDNSLRIIKSLKKEDSRIVIINNNKNMGTLYSRSIAALSAKGEYIFALDNDDMFFDIDIFDSTYKKAKKENFDIIGFKSLYIKKNYIFNIRKMEDNPFSLHKKNNLILHQPELGIYPISRKGILKKNDFMIWAKCIKTYIYKKAVNSLGILKYSIFMSWHEDISIAFIIFNIAQSFKFIHKYGIIHICSNSSASNIQPKKNKLFGELFLLNILFDFSKSNDKNLIVFFRIKIIKNSSKLKEYRNLSFLKFILKKILKCKFVKDINKKYLYKYFKNLTII